MDAVASSTSTLHSVKAYLCAVVGPFAFGAGLTSTLAALAGLVLPTCSCEDSTPLAAQECALCLL